MQVKLNSTFMRDLADLPLLMIYHRAVTIAVTSAVLEKGYLGALQSSGHWAPSASNPLFTWCPATLHTAAHSVVSLHSLFHHLSAQLGTDFTMGLVHLGLRWHFVRAKPAPKCMEYLLPRCTIPETCLAFNVYVVSGHC